MNKHRDHIGSLCRTFKEAIRLVQAMSYRAGFGNGTYDEVHGLRRSKCYVIGYAITYNLRGRCCTRFRLGEAGRPSLAV